jgi:hypothetical protein
VAEPPPDAADSPSDAPSSPAGPAGEDAPSLDEIANVWPAVLDNLRQNAPALAATFEGARPVGLDGDGVTIGFPAALTFNKRKAEAPDKREQMGAALETTLGTRLRPVYVMLEEDEGAADAGEAEVDHEALVERMKSEFNAEEVG